jgi:hypothetical protein
MPRGHSPVSLAPFAPFQRRDGKRKVSKAWDWKAPLPNHSGCSRSGISLTGQVPVQIQDRREAANLRLAREKEPRGEGTGRVTCRSAGRGLAGSGMMGPTSFTVGGSARGYSRAKSMLKRFMTQRLSAAGEPRSMPCLSPSGLYIILPCKDTQHLLGSMCISAGTPS